MHKPLLPLLLSLFALPAFAGGFEALSLPGSQLAALSADGRSAVGGLIGSVSGGFRWHEGKPIEFLAAAVSVRAISASGRHATGSSLDEQQREVATWWDAAGVAHALGGLTGADASAGVLSVGYGITDEPQVVGTSASGADSVAFRWSAAQGMRRLAADGAGSAAIGISDDGHRIYGWSTHEDGPRRGTVWIDGHACCMAGIERGGDELVGANREATILLGIAGDDAHAQTPYRRDSDTRRMPIETTLAAPLKFGASSDDGNLLVGTAGNGGQRVAVVWTQAGGVERLQDFLAAHAIDVPSGWTSLLAATAVSADGRRIGGFGLRDGRFDSFIADVSSTDLASRPPTAH
jgi:uncharacterized membrane protein